MSVEDTVMMPSGMCERYQSLSTGIARALGARNAWLLERSFVDACADVLSLCSAKVVLTEPLGGCPVKCQDIRSLGEDARAQGTALVINGSAVGVQACAAVRLGAHVELLEADNACVAAVSRDVERALPGISAFLDGCKKADEPTCLQIEALLAERDAVWRATSDAAQVVASYLRCHPRVRQVAYPGLKGDASFSVAARTLQNGFGPLVSWLDMADGRWRQIACTTEDAREQVVRLESELAAMG